MYYWVTLLLVGCMLLKIAKDRRRMGYAVIYVAILVVDVIVGSTIIAWKCKLLGDEDECQLAICGTLGSVIMWLLLLFVCPYCLVQFDFYPYRRQISDTFEKTYSRLTHKKSNQLGMNLQTSLLLSRNSNAKDGYKTKLLSQDSLQPITDVSNSSLPALVEIVTETEKTPFINNTNDGNR